MKLNVVPSGNLRYFSSAALRFRRRVETLDPSSFEARGQKPLDLCTTRGSSPSLQVNLGGALKCSMLSYQRSKDNASTGFPSNSIGYLYFRPAAPNRPRITGELRFRLATAPEHFERGEDLKLPSGEPWRRPLFTLMPTASHKPLYDKLVEEGLVSQAEDRVVADFCTTTGVPPFLRAWRYDWSVLYSLSDPFILHLSYPEQHMRGLTDTGIMHLVWQFTPFRTHGSYSHCPSSGIVRLRFEPSTLPEHSGKRTVVLRVLDILEPIRFWSPDTNEEKPLLQVGELVPSDGVHGSTPLSFNLDDPKPYRKGVNKVAKLLKFLWESDPLLGRAAVGSESVQSSAAFHSSQAWANWTARLIKTLDPKKLREKGQMPLDLAAHPSDSSSFWTGLKIASSSTPVQQTDFEASTSRLRGYLYFQSAQPDKPQISGALRFRLAKTPDDFATGEDLKLPNGNPWSKPLFALAKYAPNRHLFDKVLEDGLVSKEVHRFTDTLLEKRGKAAYPAWEDNIVLYTLSDPFIIDPSSAYAGIHLWGITDIDSVRGLLSKESVDYLRWVWSIPFKGSICVRFEPSTLPEHAGTRTAVLRLLETLDPVELHNNDGGSVEAGELAASRQYKSIVEATSFNLDNGELRKGRLVQSTIQDVLRNLWEADVKRGILPNRPPSSF